MFHAHTLAQTRKPSSRYRELDPETLHKCAMDHCESVVARGFSSYWIFYRFSGVQRDPSRFKTWSPFWDPGRPALRYYFSFFQNRSVAALSKEGIHKILWQNSMNWCLNNHFHVTKGPKKLFSYLNQVVCGFTAAQQSTSHKRKILHAVLRS